MTTWRTRPETSDDVPAIHAVNVAAFDTPSEAKLVDTLRAGPAWIPGLSIVAETADGVIAGHALLTRGHIDDVPTLGLGPCAVVPAHQRSGAGTAAVRHALAAARDLGERHVVVLGHPEYYPRFGFRPASAFGISLPISVPDEAFMATGLIENEDPPAGVMRYAAPFGV